MSGSDRAPENPILDYVQRLVSVKKGLPFVQPVCVFISHSVNDAATLIRIASEIGPHIAILQIQADVIDDWTQNTIDQLLYLSKRHGFILWEGSRVLNATVNFMGRGTANWETQKVMADLITRKYTNGPIRTAQWSNMATTWAPGVPLSEQEKDVLIPTLRKAAREAVATTAKTIQTEISAEESDDVVEDGEMTLSPPTTGGWHEFSSDNGVSLRKSSTISVSESTTIQPHVEPEDGVPAPPLLARGVTLCLPSSIDTAFTYEFRQSTIGAACSNPDFVLGFLTSEPFFCYDRGDDIIEVAFSDGVGNSNMGMGRNLLASSPYMEKDAYTFALFSLLSPEYAKSFEFDPSRTVNGDAAHDSQPLSVTKLFYLMRQAVKSRELHHKEKQTNGQPEGPHRGPRILQIPVAILP